MAPGDERRTDNTSSTSHTNQPTASYMARRCVVVAKCAFRRTYCVIVESYTTIVWDCVLHKIYRLFNITNKRQRYVNIIHTAQYYHLDNNEKTLCEILVINCIPYIPLFIEKVQTFVASASHLSSSAASSLASSFSASFAHLQMPFERDQSTAGVEILF